MTPAVALGRLKVGAGLPDAQLGARTRMIPALKSVNFTAKSRAMIGQHNRIIDIHRARGLRLTRRQLVAVNFPWNVERSCKSPSRLVSDASFSGLLNWDGIESRVRTPRVPRSMRLGSGLGTRLHPAPWRALTGQLRHTRPWATRTGGENMSPDYPPSSAGFPGHVPAHGTRRHPDSKLQQQLRCDPLLAPGDVIPRHGSDHPLEFRREPGPAGARPPAPGRKASRSQPSSVVG